MLLKLNNISNQVNSFIFKNIILNSNFTSTSNWNSAYSTSVVNNNILTNTANGTNVTPYINQTPILQYVQNKKIYFKLKVRVTNSSCVSLSRAIIVAGMTSVINNILTPVQNQWYDASELVTLGAGGSGNVDLRIRHNYVDTTTANGKVMEVSNVMAIDLTTLYGAGNEPSATDCANIFSFVDGTKQPNFSKQIAL